MVVMVPIAILDAIYCLKSKLNRNCSKKIFNDLTLTIWEGPEVPYSKLLPSPICEKKVNEASLQNTVNAPSTRLCLLLHKVAVDQGGETGVQIWTGCNADVCHGEDGKAAAATVYALHLLPFQLFLLARLMVIGCRPRPPDGGQAAIFETLAGRFLKTS